MRRVIFELCAETIDACLVAKAGGAARIELCSVLSEGGVTPSHGLVRQAVALSGLPVHVLIRPRGGGFSYSDAEFSVMQEDIEHMKTLGARGVVLGVLRRDGQVDTARTRQLVELAKPMEVTFHRAFDCTVSLERALEDVIATGCTRVLTSGGAPDVSLGAETLARLVHQAGERIDVAVGGGLRLHNAAAVAAITGAVHFHGSLWQPEHAGTTDGSSPVEAASIRAMIDQLQSA